MLRTVTVSLLLASSLASAQPALTEPAPAEPVTTSYRSQTMTADGIALGLLLGGAMTEGANGQDSAATELMYGAGALTAIWAAPLIHGLRGHGGRFMASLGLRTVLTGVAVVGAMEMREGCEGFLCELDHVGVAFLGGLVVAMAIDNAFLTDEVVEAPPRFVPTIAASPDGARVGVAMTW